MTLRSHIVPAFLLVAAVSGGVAHAENTSPEKRDTVTFRPWIGTLGVHFHSERLFEDASSLASSPDGRSPGDDLSGQASAAGLHGFGLGGEWRPFGNGVRLNLAMYLDAAELGEPRGIRSWELYESGSPADNPIVSASDFDAVPYVGLGWQTNEGGVDVNLDVGAFLPGESPMRNYACLSPDSPLAECGTATLGFGRGKLSGSPRRFEWHPVVSLGIEYRF